MLHPQRIEPGPGQESVWDYPRPPRLESVPQRLLVRFAGEVIAETTRGYRVLETSHPPVYYFPPDDVQSDFIVPVDGTTHCEWKGRAAYFDVRVGEQVAERVAYSYPAPVARFEAITDYLSFYAGPMDECHVGDEIVEPQPGDFYSGWITPDIVGPIKGGPGSRGW
ncbi:DUF427 domain-containing protein [Stratiformator vulcanicus]|uniref:DUF427 domain-containing protein n=1 Tax=Stratiformator vulcanicus TaxID=2527980 RepID=A0A517R665_9PLAN|nr:DUF427 domain-containing protein [Stratiformator vulcanicus]QDT39359.1 hypothetical protein Pan189_37650 [Stratiformator vulcanicus]